MSDRSQPTQIETTLFQALLAKHDNGKLSMNAIARASGVDVSTISRILSGARAGVGLHTAGLLCKYLGLKLGKPATKQKDKRT